MRADTGKSPKFDGYFDLWTTVKCSCRAQENLYFICTKTTIIH